MYSAITNKKRLLRESRVYYNSQLLYFSEMSANSLWDKCEWAEFLRFYISQKYKADFTLIYTSLHAKIKSDNYTLSYTQFTPWHTHKPGFNQLWFKNWFHNDSSSFDEKCVLSCALFTNITILKSEFFMRSVIWLSRCPKNGLRKIQKLNCCQQSSTGSLSICLSWCDNKSDVSSRVRRSKCLLSDSNSCFDLIRDCEFNEIRIVIWMSDTME